VVVSAKGQCTGDSASVSQGAVYMWPCSGGGVGQVAVYGGSVQVAMSARGQCTRGSLSQLTVCKWQC